MELELTCKGWSKWKEGDVKDNGKPVKEKDISPVMKGYGMGVSSIRPLEGATLYSVLDKLPKLMLPTLDKSRSRQTDWQNQFSSITKLVETNAVSFFIKRVNPEVSIEVDAKFSGAASQISLFGWVPPEARSSYDDSKIDILNTHAMKATNCSTIENACCLLEVAAAAGALSLIVCYNQYRSGKVNSFLYTLLQKKTRVPETLGTSRNKRRVPTLDTLWWTLESCWKESVLKACFPRAAAETLWHSRPPSSFQTRMRRTLIPFSWSARILYALPRMTASRQTSPSFLQISCSPIAGPWSTRPTGSASCTPHSRINLWPGKALQTCASLRCRWLVSSFWFFFLLQQHNKL